MGIKIHKPGPFSTIQDLGRFDFLSAGVSQSGAMDTSSARMANIALGNSENEAVIEFTYAQAEIEILSDTLLAYAGGGAILLYGEQMLPPNRPLALSAGMYLKLSAYGHGSRTYLAASGGWNIPSVMGSKSTYLAAKFGGLHGRLLKTGDVLHTHKWEDKQEALFKHLLNKNRTYPHWALPSTIRMTTGSKMIRVLRGPEAEWFTLASRQQYFSATFEIDRNSNRMGYRLQGAPIYKKEQKLEMLSTAVIPGTIQIPGDGNPILLMADCQTTGGYPRIAQVAAVDLPLCGQLKPGDRIYFKEISIIEAEKLYLEQELHYRLMKSTVDLKYCAQ